MARDLTVAACFKATVSKEDSTPKTFESHGQTFQVWRVKFEGRTDWVSVNRKLDNEIVAGDILYGDIVENQWGKFDFKSAQRPLGSVAPTPRNIGETPASGLEKRVADLEARMTAIEQAAGIVELEEDPFA